MNAASGGKGSKMLNSLRLIAFLVIFSLFTGCAAKNASVAEKEVCDPPTQAAANSDASIESEVSDSGVEPLDPEVDAAPQESEALTPEEEKVLKASNGIFSTLMNMIPKKCSSTSVFLHIKPEKLLDVGLNEPNLFCLMFGRSFLKITCLRILPCCRSPRAVIMPGRIPGSAQPVCGSLCLTQVVYMVSGLTGGLMNAAILINPLVPQWNT